MNALWVLRGKVAFQPSPNRFLVGTPVCPEQLDHIARGNDNDRMLIFHDFLVCLRIQKACRHQDAELPMAKTRDEPRDLTHSNSSTPMETKP